MARTRKQIAFDLDTKALEKYYPTDNWRNAYEIIKKHMQDYNFEWRQGSVYISKSPMNEPIANAAITDLVKKNSWLNLCMRDCIVTNIGKEYSKNNLFDKSMKIPTREEMNETQKKDTPDGAEVFTYSREQMKQKAAAISQQPGNPTSKSKNKKHGIE